MLSNMSSKNNSNDLPGQNNSNENDDGKKKRSQASLKYYYSNRIERLEKQKIYNLRNKEKIKKDQELYFQKNKILINNNNKKYVNPCPILQEKYNQGLRYQKAYYRKTHLDKSTWKTNYFNNSAAKADINDKVHIISFI